MVNDVCSSSDAEEDVTDVPDKALRYLDIGVGPSISAFHGASFVSSRGCAAMRYVGQRQQ
jgi:hypothetical protein